MRSRTTVASSAPVSRNEARGGRWLSPPRVSLGLFALALAVRLAHAVEIQDSPYLRTLVLDTEEYQLLARGLLEGRWTDAVAGTYVHGFLYPACWALFDLAGAGHAGLRATQALLGALSCVLLYDVGRRLLTPVAAAGCGLAASLYWPYVLFSSQLVATTLVLFLVLAAFSLLLRLDTRPAAALGAGLALGLLITTRANAALLVPAVFAGLVWRARSGVAARRPAAWLALGIGIAVVPYATLNWHAQGTPLPHEGAWSFYLGANPEADGTPYARPGLDWQRLESLGYRDGVHTPAPRRGRIYLEEVIRFAVAEPAAYARLLYRKLRLFWHAYEIPVSVDLHHYDDTLLARWLFLDFGFVAPLALVGLLARRRDRRWLPAYAGAAAFLLSCLLFTVCSRYRLPATPFLVLFAAAAVTDLAGAVRARHRSLWRFWAPALLAAVVVTRTGVDPAAVDHLRSAWLRGELQLRDGDAAAAERLFREALAEDAVDADVLSSLGAAIERQGRTQEAEALYRRSLAVAPDHSLGWLRLAALQRRRGDTRLAVLSVERALAADTRPGSHFRGSLELGHIHLEAGELEAASSAFSRAVEIQERPLGLYALASAYHAQGRYDAERQALERAVRLAPGYAAAHANLGAVRLHQGDLEGAERSLRRAAALDPGVASVHRRLGVLYRKTGRDALAREAFETASRLGR